MWNFFNWTSKSFGDLKGGRLPRIARRRMHRTHFQKGNHEQDETHDDQCTSPPVFGDPCANRRQRHRIQEEILEPYERSLAVHRPTLGEDVTVAHSAHARRARLQYEALTGVRVHGHLGNEKRIDTLMLSFLTSAG